MISDDGCGFGVPGGVTCRPERVTLTPSYVRLHTDLYMRQVATLCCQLAHRCQGGNKTRRLSPVYERVFKLLWSSGPGACCCQRPPDWPTDLMPTRCQPPDGPWLLLALSSRTDVHGSTISTNPRFSPTATQCGQFDRPSKPKRTKVYRQRQHHCCSPCTYAVRERRVASQTRRDHSVAMTAFSATPLDMSRPDGDANPHRVQDGFLSDDDSLNI